MRMAFRGARWWSDECWIEYEDRHGLLKAAEVTFIASLGAEWLSDLPVSCLEVDTNEGDGRSDTGRLGAHSMGLGGRIGS